jgi:hypothetical protein
MIALLFIIPYINGKKLSSANESRYCLTPSMFKKSWPKTIGKQDKPGHL